jgi:hypothetical protein
VVSGRVDKQEAGQIEVRGVDEFAGDLRDDVQRHGGRADVLGDRAGFALDDGGAAHLVEQARLAVIDVSEDGYDRRSEGGCCGFGGFGVRHSDHQRRFLCEASWRGI